MIVASFKRTPAKIATRAKARFAWFDGVPIDRQKVERLPACLDCIWNGEEMVRTYNYRLENWKRLRAPF